MWRWIGYGALWSSLAFRLEKSGIMEHYGIPITSVHLRLFGEQVYGRGPGGQNDVVIIKMQIRTEKRGGGNVSVMDVLSLFG